MIVFKDDLKKQVWMFEHKIADATAHDAESLYHLMHRAEAWQSQGYFVVMRMTYEAGYIFQSLPLPPVSVPLLRCVAYRDCRVLSTSAWMTWMKAHHAHWSVHHLRWLESYAAYQAAYARVHEHLARGDTYQVNLTTRCLFDLEGSIPSFYEALSHRQQVAYAVLWDDEQDTILSYSPELFFLKQGNTLTMKPMKGTMSRGRTMAQDHHHREKLMHDPKTRAENSMIVDLLRNDLSKIAVPGSVSVTHLMAIETYETLFQMTSTIVCTLTSNTCLWDIMAALFPCGSITGAPKKRTMDIIQATESSERGIYTGTIGVLYPDGDMCFNVAIRTMNIQDGQGVLGLGGGVLYASECWSEWDEIQLKGRFFTDWAMRYG